MRFAEPRMPYYQLWELLAGRHEPIALPPRCHPSRWTTIKGRPHSTEDGLLETGPGLAPILIFHHEKLQIITGRYRSRSRFITNLTHDPPAFTQDLAGLPLRDDDYLVLGTINSAKGCEWDAVYIIHAADGMIPSKRATGSKEEIGEERRLLYVAMTRALAALSIYLPLRDCCTGSRLTDRHSYAQLTRFIPESSLHLYDRAGPSRTGAEEHAQDLAVDHQALQSVDTMLENLWHD